MKTFAIIGAAGYIAPRHMEAIKDVGGKLVAALDPHDSVGILDRFAPECLYFKEPERFDRWLSKNPVDYVVVCSPNYLHDSHCLLAMRNGCDVICEKPATCNERNLDNLADWEIMTGKKVNVILQCRLHKESIAVKKAIKPNKEYSVKVVYKTPRGNWYDYSWKSDVYKSGGLPTNIGVHLFDLCWWLFGPGSEVMESNIEKHAASGIVNYANAVLRWHLSIEQGAPERMFSIWSDVGKLFDLNLTNGFTDLHTESYRRILDGNGFGIEDTRPAIRIVEGIRNANQ